MAQTTMTIKIRVFRRNARHAGVHVYAGPKEGKLAFAGDLTLENSEADILLRYCDMTQADRDSLVELLGEDKSTRIES